METSSGINLLYIDDELNNLLSFKALFRQKYHLYLAQNIAEAVKLLEDNTIHVLLTDQRMPGITGLEFVEMIDSKYPQLARVLITGYAPEKDIRRALNSGQIYTCLAKPWDEAELEEVILEAYALYTDRKAAAEKAYSSLSLTDPAKDPSPDLRR